MKKETYRIEADVGYFPLSWKFENYLDTKEQYDILKKDKEVSNICVFKITEVIILT
jgi:hypothetical protein